MACKDIIVLIALLAISAAVKQELRHPPHHHGPYHHAVPHTDPEETPLAEQPLPAQEEIADDNENDLEGIQDEDVIEDARQVNQRLRQEETEEIQNELDTKAAWVDCDYNLIPGKSCYDCQTRVICKYPGGGKLVGCNNALRPYCNNGICTATPSSGCA